MLVSYDITTARRGNVCVQYVSDNKLDRLGAFLVCPTRSSGFDYYFSVMWGTRWGGGGVSGSCGERWAAWFEGTIESFKELVNGKCS